MGIYKEILGVALGLLLTTTQAKAGKIVLASESEVKRAAVEAVFGSDVFCCQVESGVANQPVGREAAVEGVRNRLNNLPSSLVEKATQLIAIENFIEEQDGCWVDRAVVLLKSGKQEQLAWSGAVRVPPEYIAKAQAADGKNDTGFSVTIGELMAREHDVDAKDWHATASAGGISRKDLLKETLFKAQHADEIGALKQHITMHQDFPKKGVLFQDFTPLLRDPVAVKSCIDMLVSWYAVQRVEAVMGLESRGFIFGSLLAYRLEVPFIPVRKKGKLPGRTVSADYIKEYGVDTFEISEDALEVGQRVLIVDDLIATGGSAVAATELATKVGANPMGFFSLLEVPGLPGRENLGIPSFILID